MWDKQYHLAKFHPTILWLITFGQIQAISYSDLYTEWNTCKILLQSDQGMHFVYSTSKEFNRCIQQCLVASMYNYYSSSFLKVEVLVP